jgi:hypothetical protein
MNLLKASLLLLPLALLACDDGADDDFGANDDTSSSSGGVSTCSACTCETAITLSGQVDGAAMPSDEQGRDSTWFNQSLDEIILTELDEVAMEQLGLDPSDQPDIERYRYLVTQADYRFLASDAGPDFTRQKDVTVFFFDLTGHPADLDHPVAVFDLSAVEEARDSGDLEALGDAVRAAADAIRDNGQPDVVVAYAADRYDEGLGNLLISLLSPTARYASSGQGWIHGVQPTEGDAIATITPPLPTLFSISVRVEPVFPDADDTMRIEASCLSVTMSGR